MSDCTPHEPKLSAWVDGELGRGDRARVGAHLQRCARCRNEVGSLRVTQSLLRSLPPRTFAADVDVPAATRHWLPSRTAVGRVAVRSSAVAVLLAGVVSAAGFVAGARPAQPATVAVPVDVYVADHMVRAVGGPVSTPALVEPKR